MFSKFWFCNPLTKRRALLNEQRAPLSIRRKTDAKHGADTHICALNREICQIRKDEELRCQTVGENFFYFAKKIMDGSHLPNCDVFASFAFESQQSTHVCIVLPLSDDSFGESWALCSSEKISNFGTAASSFLFDKYYPIID